MINIAYVIDTIHSPYAGTEKQLLAIIRLLDRSRFQPHLVCLRSSDWLRETDDGCPVEILNFGSLLSTEFFTCRKHFVRFCRDNKIDIVQTFFRDGNLAGTLWAQKAHVPVIIASRRNIGGGYWHNRREIAILRYLRRYVSQYIANSEAAANETHMVEKVDRDRISVIGNGLDVDDFSPPTPEQKKRIKEAYGFSEDNMVIGAVANLRPVKNLEFLIRAADLIIESYPEARFVVLGEGHFRHELEDLIHTLGLGDKFRLPGSTNNVARDLAGLDIAVLCSHRESLSNSLMEYMAMGLPTVASDVGGNRELISDDKIGFIYPPDDTTTFVRYVSTLLEKPNLREQVGRAAREYAANRFSYRTMIEQHEKLYASLVPMNASGQPKRAELS